MPPEAESVTAFPEQNVVGPAADMLADTEERESMVPVSVPILPTTSETDNI